MKRPMSVKIYRANGTEEDVPVQVFATDERGAAVAYVMKHDPLGPDDHMAVDYGGEDEEASL